MQDPNRPVRIRRRTFLQDAAGERAALGSRAVAGSLGEGGPMQDPNGPFPMRRRTFLQATAAAILLASCGGEEPEQKTVGKAPAVEFKEPSGKLSGSLKILLWSHFVPRHDKWFDPFAKEWGKKVGVDVTVDHIEVTAIPARIEAEIAA